MNKIRINQGRAFLFHIRLGGSFICLVCMAVSFQYLPEIPAISLAILFSLGIPFFWSAFEILEIDHDSSKLSEYMLIMGRRFQENVTPYAGIEKIFVNRVKKGQVMTSMAGHVSTVKNFEYHAYLKTTDGNKHLLLSDKNNQNLRQKLDKIGKKLGTSIVENFD